MARGQTLTLFTFFRMAHEVSSDALGFLPCLVSWPVASFHPMAAQRMIYRSCNDTTSRYMILTSWFFVSEALDLYRCCDGRLASKLSELPLTQNPHQ